MSSVDAKPGLAMVMLKRKQEADLYVAKYAVILE